MRLSSLWLCLTLLGCASPSGGGNPFQGTRTRVPRDGPVQVAVENNAYLDMHIYVYYSGGQSRSLGMVSGLSRRTLVIPNQVVQTLSGIQLFADPIGTSQGYLSQTLLAYPGQRIRFTIQNLLSLSSAWIEGGYAEEEEDADDEDTEEEQGEAGDEDDEDVEQDPSNDGRSPTAPAAPILR